MIAILDLRQSDSSPVPVPRGADPDEMARNQLGILSRDDYAVINAPGARELKLFEREPKSLELPKVPEWVVAHINRYMMARHGKDYVYRAPETFGPFEQWLIFVSTNNEEAADRAMQEIESYFQNARCSGS